MIQIAKCIRTDEDGILQYNCDYEIESIQPNDLNIVIPLYNNDSDTIWFDKSMFQIRFGNINNPPRRISPQTLYGDDYEEDYDNDDDYYDDDDNDDDDDDYEEDNHYHENHNHGNQNKANRLASTINNIRSEKNSGSIQNFNTNTNNRGGVNNMMNMNSITKMFSESIGMVKGDQFRMSLTGAIAIKVADKYMTYDGAVMTDQMGMVVDVDNIFLKRPVKANKLKEKDLIIYNNKPYYVKEVNEDATEIKVFNVNENKIEILVPHKHVLGFNYLVKVDSMIKLDNTDENNGMTKALMLAGFAGGNFQDMFPMLILGENSMFEDMDETTKTMMLAGMMNKGQNGQDFGGDIMNTMFMMKALGEGENDMFEDPLTMLAFAGGMNPLMLMAMKKGKKKAVREERTEE